MTTPAEVTEEIAVRAAELALEKYGVSQEYRDRPVKPLWPGEAVPGYAAAAA